MEEDEDDEEEDEEDNSGDGEAGSALPKVRADDNEGRGDRGLGGAEALPACVCCDAVFFLVRLDSRRGQRRRSDNRGLFCSLSVERPRVDLFFCKLLFI